MKKKSRTNQATPGANDMGFYHAKCGPFTKKLKKLMKDYPGVPVIIPQLCSANYDDMECKIADVYDQNGAFRERVITIWSAENPLPFGPDVESRENMSVNNLPF